MKKVFTGILILSILLSLCACGVADAPASTGTEPTVPSSEATVPNAKPTVAYAREAQAGTSVQVCGVVAAITYANGKVPCGFILVDETASIYVYSNDVAAQVAVGNQVEITASKTYWVLETEQDNAALYGYLGACQLENVTLVSNDKGTHDFDRSWVEETTVKAILDTGFDRNITTQLYKVTALIEKVPGTGFVNYYIRDLDGVTGSYTYTQCNGSDFAWLDAYDGKICTVYLTALNAKSTPAECFYRFMPVAVEEIQDFSYPIEKAPAFALEYAVKDLFEESYGADPALMLPTSYSNDLLGFQNVTLSYAVSGEGGSVEEAEGQAVLHLNQVGSYEVTATATYGEYTAEWKVTVTREAAAEIVTPTVAEIIGTEDGTLVQIRGVVISSLVNRDGFYIGDKTGMIAVLTSGEVLSQVKPGDQVVMEGYKIHFKKDGSDHCIGQCAIVGSMDKTSNAKLLANYYGDHEYATDHFITDMTIDRLYELDAMEDYTTNVYKLSATVVVEGGEYYSNILLKDPDGQHKLRLYCSSARQYGWLAAYSGMVVELELALCNWNDKDYYTGCVISATVAGSKIINELNFQ